MPDGEFAELVERCGQQWTEDYRKDMGKGWELLSPKTAEEYIRTFVEYAKKGYKVYAEYLPKTNVYFIYVKKRTETKNLDNLFKDIFGKHGQKWTVDYRRDMGKGWELLPERPKTTEEYNRIFVEYAKKGYKVYAEYRTVAYHIFVKKQDVAEWRNAVRDMRIKSYNFKYIVEEVLKNFYIPEKDVVDYIILNYIGRDYLKKAVYKPEKRIVHVAPVIGPLTAVPGIYYYYLVEGVGLRDFRALSFDPVEIATLEKTGMYPPEVTYHVEELKKVIRDYRLGYTDASTAIEEIIEIVERM